MNHQPARLTDADLAHIFAPNRTRTGLEKDARGCQRIIDHYAAKGQFDAAAMTLAIVCKHLLEEIKNLHERLGPPE